MRESSRLYSGRGPANVSSKIVTGPILSKLYSRQAGWLREAENPRTCHADNDMFPVVSSPTRYGSTTRVMPSYGKLTRRREAIASHRVVFFIFSLPNVPRQVSLAGGNGESHEKGAKALGLLFCQQALCVSGGTSNRCSSKLPTGQRLTERVGSAIFFPDYLKSTSISYPGLRGKKPPNTDISSSSYIFPELRSSTIG
jgi:hypothetical protein